jgi:hypothetical protein
MYQIGGVRSGDNDIALVLIVEDVLLMHHPAHPNAVKGIKVVLMEHGLFTDCL